MRSLAAVLGAITLAFTVPTTAHAAPATCGNNQSDYTGAAWSNGMVFNSDGTLTYSDARPGATWSVEPSDLALGGHGMVSVTYIQSGGGGGTVTRKIVGTPTCLVGTTVREISGTQLTTLDVGSNIGLDPFVITRPSL